MCICRMYFEIIISNHSVVLLLYHHLKRIEITELSRTHCRDVDLRWDTGTVV